MNGIKYGWPGAGAAEYAIERTPELKGATLTRKNRSHLLKLVRDYMAAPMPDDPRIKQCAYCNYLFRDKTRPNNSKTCSRECKIDKDTKQRASKRPVISRPKRIENPEIKFMWWWKYEVPMDTAGIEYIDGNQQIYGKGNRKRFSRSKKV